MGTIWAFLKKYTVIWIFLLFWELICRLGWVNPLFIPSFTTVLKTLGNMLAKGELTLHLIKSLQRAILGFIIGIAAGIPLGVILAGWSPKMQLVIRPVIEVFSQINPFILIHILLLFLGFGESPKIISIGWMCIWPIAYCTLTGIRNIDENLVKSSRAFGLSRTQLVYKVLIPAAAPSLFMGLRISAGYATFMLIGAEMMGASNGLGFLITNSQEYYRIDRVFAGVLVIAVIGLILDGTLGHFETKAHVREVS